MAGMRVHNFGDTSVCSVCNEASSAGPDPRLRVLQEHHASQLLRIRESQAFPQGTVRVPEGTHIPQSKRLHEIMRFLGYKAELEALENQARAQGQGYTPEDFEHMVRNLTRPETTTASGVRFFLERDETKEARTEDDLNILAGVEVDDVLDGEPTEEPSPKKPDNASQVHFSRYVSGDQQIQILRWQNSSQTTEERIGGSGEGEGKQEE